jgi:hypothetical protein
MRFAFDILEQAHEDILAQCRGADLVVVAASSAAGKNEADLLAAPNVSVNFMPWALPVDELRAAASALGEQVRAEDGVAGAVRLIEETFG